MPKNTPPDIREIEEFWRNGQDVRAFGGAVRRYVTYFESAFCGYLDPSERR